MTHASLQLAWRRGDSTAANRLLRSQIPAIRRYFERRAPEAVDDLVQATLLAAVANKEGAASATCFRSYLFGIARHQVFRHLRSRRRDRLVLGTPPCAHHAVSIDGPAERLIEQRTQAQVAAALNRISDDLRHAVQLHYYDELSTAELAQSLRIPRGTAKSRLRRAREALQTELGVTDTSRRASRACG